MSISSLVKLPAAIVNTIENWTGRSGDSLKIPGGGTINPTALPDCDPTSRNVDKFETGTPVATNDPRIAGGVCLVP